MHSLEKMAHGKSTILKIISGEEKQDSGNVNIRKDSNIGYLKQIYPNEIGNIKVKEYMQRSFQEYFDIEDKLKKLEHKNN